MAVNLETTARESLSERFDRLLSRWRDETKFLSAAEDLVEHPAWQEIIRMGDPVVPPLLRELQRKPDLLFQALTTITGEDPVPEERKGNLKAMTEAWLGWGRKRGYVAQPRTLTS